MLVKREEYADVSMRDVDNDYTLNIFCDASIIGYTIDGDQYYDGCGGAVAIHKGQIVDETFRLATYTTNNNCEIKAVRAGVYLALKYRSQFPVINLFSDSQICIFGLRDRLLNWTTDNLGLELRGSANKAIASQEIFLEIAYLMVDNNLRINFLHQKGHVSGAINSLMQAQHVFIVSNSLRGKVSMEFIRFISDWNNYVDQKSREILKNYDHTQKEYIDPIGFYPAKFNRGLYRELSKNTVNKGAFS